MPIRGSDDGKPPAQAALPDANGRNVAATPVTRAGRGRRGHTILELMVALALAAPVMLMIWSGSSSVVTASGVAVSSAASEASLRATIRNVRRAVAAGRVLHVASDGLSLVYQQPLRLPGEATAVREDGSVRWGEAADGAAVAGGVSVLTFVEDDQLVEGDLGRDLNEDGDLEDAFLRGHIETLLPGGRPRILSPPVVLVDADASPADLDGDGETDPLFQWNGESLLTVKLLTLAGAPGRASPPTFTRLQIHLPNASPREPWHDQ